MLISAIDQQTNRLLYQWMITVNVKEANITKMFEVYLQNKRNQTIASYIVINFSFHFISYLHRNFYCHLNLFYHTAFDEGIYIFVFQTLAVRNRYSVERSFRISCSHPENVRIENDTVMLPGYKAIDVPITFLLNNELKLPEVYLPQFSYFSRSIAEVFNFQMNCEILVFIILFL